MATRTLVLTVCDMPHDAANAGDAEPAFPVTVTTPDGTWTVDVCPSHAAHFLMPVISSGAPVKRTRNRRAPVPA